ncbi:hypothetical protein QZH41_019279 [Actinostola sp. cb2023]|nr:hypothetical protein QZH41_019279 [Actinostola sp. cb2023]
MSEASHKTQITTSLKTLSGVEESEVFTHSNPDSNLSFSIEEYGHQPSSDLGFEIVDRDMAETGYNRREFSRREVLKAKLKYHYMNPWQKYKARKRKPWKLVIQIFKIIIVTVQVVLFGTDRFSVVTFLEDNRQALQHLFLNDYSIKSTGSKIIYTRDEALKYLRYAHGQYYNVADAVGSYDYTYLDSNGSVPRVMLCYERYTNVTFDPALDTFIVDKRIIPSCSYLPKPQGGYHIITNSSFQFGSLVSLKLNFTLNAINLKGVRSWDKPSCYALDVTITFDNSKLDGQMPISLGMKNRWLKCKTNSEIDSPEGEIGHLILVGFLVFDVVVIVICLLSLILCLRSLVKSLHLAKEARGYFKEVIDDPLTLSEIVELFNLWFCVIIVSDFLTILGSIYKIAIEQKDREYYDICSLLLGIAVLLVWCGLLRFLEYFPQYNALLVTVKDAGPSVLRFCICSGVLFMGFTFCGWIVLGPHHEKFRDTTITAECLYSLINGDDMYNTYALVSPKSEAIWIYSKLYLYVFISLFIYVVLSLFIGIISDTYERLKVSSIRHPFIDEYR